MPKVNVYLADELALAVREAKIPVSAVCQQALTEAVRAVGRARTAVRALRRPDVDDASLREVTAGIARRATPRLASAFDNARAASRADGVIGTAELLLGILDEGHNLAVSILASRDVDLDKLRRSAAAVAPGTEEAASGDTSGEVGGSVFSATQLSLPARLALAATLEAAIDLGHNYLGCEHLLLALVTTKGGVAAQLLASAKVDEAATRGAVKSAVAGVAHARAVATAAPAPIGEILRRLDAIERRLATAE